MFGSSIPRILSNSWSTITKGPKKHLGGGIIRINLEAAGGAGKLPPATPCLDGTGWCSGLKGVIWLKRGLTNDSFSVYFLRFSKPVRSAIGRRPRRQEAVSGFSS